MFGELLDLIFEYSNDGQGFFAATRKLDDFISTTRNFPDILEQIGTIPESIGHDSTEEKLFAKASDAVLSRAFRELGLKSTVLSERADSADVIAKSPLFGYTLVADAKAFRLSRTAKNQKDFKVGALSGWRKENDYAILCSPYFQYPSTRSQIYAQAIENNVCLLSWEHLIFLLSHDIRENKSVNLASLWNFGEDISSTTVVSQSQKCFIKDFDAHFLSTVRFSQSDFEGVLSRCVDILKWRGGIEIGYWVKERKEIMSYSRERAVDELIRSKKIDEKIRQIELYIRGIDRD